MTRTSTPTLAEVAALGVALRRFYEPEMSHDEVRKHARTGWTAEAFTHVEMLAEWVLEHGTGLSAESEGREANHALRQQIGLVFVTVNWLLLRDVPVAEALGWAAVEASAPTSADSDAVAAMLFENRAALAEKDWPSSRWLALGSIGPLAWAAGLTDVEALERQHAGTLTIEGLATLAALRGWRLPDGPR